MKKIMIVTLFNSSLNDKDEYRLMNVNKVVLDESIAANGSKEMKELLRQRIEELFNGDILEYFSDSNMEVTEGDVDYCIDELAKGHASNIAGEDFYWGDEEDLITDLHPYSHVHRCKECGSIDVEQKYWVNPNTMEIGEWCEEDEVWCNHCQEMQPYEVVQREELEVFDGTLGVRFKYNGKDYSEVIDPALAESDPDLDNVWQYRIDSGDENVRMVLRGNYLMCGDECCGLSTTMALQVKVEDVAEGEQYIDDIDII